jgi:DNA mismatch endonuclease, patch repair protein
VRSLRDRRAVISIILAMADTVSKEVRSKIMSSVRQRNTGPERLVRSLLHSLGMRFRLHRRDLPGSPDIVLPRHRIAIFVHGCFWHQHRGCPKARKPSSNNDYWDRKLADNIARDRKKSAELRKLGWKVITIWQCETRNADSIIEKLTDLIAPK